MFDYLQQFNSLAKDLRDRVSSPPVMAAVTELENKYRVDLAMIIMKVMIKNLALKNLATYFVSEAGLTPTLAENLTRELKERVFSNVADYLGLAAEIRALDLDRDIDVLIKEASLTLASGILVSRFKNILATYLRGVRSKIDTRNSLAKDVKIGGLNLSSAEIDRVLKICDSGKFKSSVSSSASTVLAKTPVSTPSQNLGSTLVKPINSDQKIKSTPVKPVVFNLPPEEYNLKQALASGQTKPVAKIEKKSISNLDTKHEIEAPEKQLDLAAPVIKPIEPIKPSAQPVGQIKPAEIVKPVSTVAPIKTITPVKPEEITRPVTIKKVEPLAPEAAGKKIEILKSTVTSPVMPRPVADRRPTPAPSPVRPQMHDIKPVPKVMGPIEELQFLDLVNFRRLGKTPAETTAKIFAKIKLLEKDGYDKMVAGVQAWRQSPTNRLYLRLGQEAIAKGIFLKDAISARQKAGQEYLNMEEIEAIVSLNSKLVF